MSYKSILSVMTTAEVAPGALDTAIEITRAEDGHLTVLCVGVDQTQTAYYYVGAAALLTPEAFNLAEQEAATAEAQVRDRLAREDIRWSVETVVTQIGAIAGPIGTMARFSDLVVMPKPYGPMGGVAAEGAVEAALFEGGAPILILPEEFTGSFGQRILMAWNQSDEALHTAKAALPLLKRAESVEITIIDPPAHGPERSDPGGMLSQFLARHGVRATISVLARSLPKTSEVLSRHARDTNADLIVMGAYGHSRFREAILGGSTRNMLENAQLPVFMAH